MKVVELHEMRLVGIRVVCPGDQYVKEIPKASVELKNRLQEIRDVVKPVRLVGAFIAEDVSGEKDGYWVCVEVHNMKQVPEGMASLVIPQQNTQSNDIRGLMMKLEIHMKISIAGY